MRPSGSITIAKHIEYRNATAEMLGRRRGIAMRHIQHSI
jgi:hypothetical protein